MLISFALTCYNRPHYLRETLDSVKRSVEFAQLHNPKLDFQIVASVEPGNEETRDVIESIDFLPCIKYYNKERLGINENGRMAFERAFEHAYYAIACDEDCKYAKDWALYCSTLLIRYEKHDDVLNISMHNAMQNRDIYKISKLYGVFVCGMSIWKDRWPWYTQNWHKHTPSFGTYDYSLNKAFPSNKCGVIPHVTRGVHTGVFGGTMVTPAMFENASPVVFSEDVGDATEWEEVPLHVLSGDINDPRNGPR